MNGKNNKDGRYRKYALLYEKSVKYRNFVLLCEVGALLHDLGKLSRLFVLSKAKDTNIKDFHGQILFIDFEKIPQSVKEFLFAPLWMFFEQNTLFENGSGGLNNINGATPEEVTKNTGLKNTGLDKEIFSSGTYKRIGQKSPLVQLSDADISQKSGSTFADFEKRFQADPLSVYYAPVLSVPYIKDIPLNIAMSHFVCAHHGCNRCLLQGYLHKPCVFDESQAHSPLRIDRHPLIKLLKTVDHLDASNPSNKGKQELFNLYRDDFFFGETRLPFERFEEMRFSFYRELDTFLRSLKGGARLNKEGNLTEENSTPQILTPQIIYMRNIEQINIFVKHLAEKYFTDALSETRRYGNDITLFDHSLATASFFKAFLYGHLVFGKTMPDSFFTVRFRVLKVKKIDAAFKQAQVAQEWNIAKLPESRNTISKAPNMSTRYLLENEIACCNAIAETDSYHFFLAPFVHGNGTFMQFLQALLSKKVIGGSASAENPPTYNNFMSTKNSSGSKTLEATPDIEAELLPSNDFARIFDGTTLCGRPLNDVLEKFRSLKVKDFADISNGYTEKQAISDVRRVVHFALLRKKEQILAKLNSSKKHLANLYNGSLHNEKNLVKYFKKESEVNRLERHLNALVSMDKIKKIHGWRSSRDAERGVYDFFNTVLSPVRPPSPVAMSFYFLKEFNRTHSFRKLAEHFLIRRPLVLGRVFALFRTLKAEFCIKIKND